MSLKNHSSVRPLTNVAINSVAPIWHHNYIHISVLVFAKTVFKLIGADLLATINLRRSQTKETELWNKQKQNIYYVKVVSKWLSTPAHSNIKTISKWSDNQSTELWIL